MRKHFFVKPYGILFGVYLKEEAYLGIPNGWEWIDRLQDRFTYKDDAMAHALALNKQQNLLPPIPENPNPLTP